LWEETVIKRIIYPSAIATFLCAVLMARAEDQVLLGSFGFEEDSLLGWTGGEGVASIDAQVVRSGKGSLTFRLDKKGAQVYRGFGIPVIKEDKARLLRITFFVKSRNLQRGNLTIRVLKTFDKPREAEWFEALNSTFMTLPVSSEWTKAVGEGLVGPEVRAVNLYLSGESNGANGQAWFDDLQVELLDRGLLLRSEKEGNVYTSNNATVDIVISAPEKIASGQVQLFDEEARLRNTIPTKPGQARIPVALPARGYYRIRAEVAYTDGTKCQLAATAAVVGPLIPDQLRMKSPFGLTGDGNLFLAAGARWDRQFSGLNYNECKAAADEGFKKDCSTPFLEVSADRTSIYCLWPQPVWLQDRKNAAAGSRWDDMYPMKDWAKFRQLVQWYVRNMSRRPLEYVEVSNEPDCSWKGPWKDLVKYHQVMAEGVKAVNSAIKVLGPCLCTIKMDEVRELVRLGLLQYIDGLSIHAYVQSTPPEAEFIQYVRDLKSYLVSIGKKDLPVFFTEYGWPVPPGDWQKPVDPLTQARYVSRSSILLVAEQIDAIQYFCLRWADPASGAYGYGLLNWDWTPRPSFPAYANAARCLTGVTGPGRVLKITPTTYLTLFNKDNGTLAAAWDIEGKSSVFVPGPWRTARDMMGGPVQEPPEGVTYVGPSPIFVELASGGLYRMKEVQSVQIRQGEDVHLPWAPAWVPLALPADGATLHIPPAAAKGSYLAMGQTSEGWQCASITVIAR
jgi:hypothetical protein